MNGLRVIVVGAGMGGLSAALALKRARFDVRVFERAPALLPVGAGISLWPNGVKVLDWLGLGAEVERMGGRLTAMEYRNPDGALLSSIPMAPLVEAVGEAPYALTRGNLQSALVQALGPQHLILDAECVAVEQDDAAVTVRLADGTVATGDVLVGADGIRSAVRAKVFPDAPEPRYAGDVMWVGLIDADRRLNPEGAFTVYVGDGKRVGVMPVSDDQLYVFLDAPMPSGWSTDSGSVEADLRSLFGAWGDPVLRLLGHLDPVSVAVLPIHDLGPLPTLVRGRVALLGDAAHAATPALGQGGAQAMEDAVVLAKYLVTTRLGVDDALRRYDLERGARTSEIVYRARQRTNLMVGNDAKATARWYRELRRRQDGEFVDLQRRVILDGPFG